MPNDSERIRTMPERLRQLQIDWLALELDARARTAMRLTFLAGEPESVARLVRWLFASPDFERVDESTRSIRQTSFAAIGREIGVQSKSTVHAAIQRLLVLGVIRVDTAARWIHGGRLQRGTRIELSWPRFFHRFSDPANAAAQAERSPFDSVATERDRTQPNDAKEKSPHTPLKENIQTQPPPPPLTVTGSASDSATGAESWRSVQAAAAAVLDDWERPLAAAQRHGCDAGHVLGLIDEYRRRQADAPHQYGPGALHLRLCQAHPAKAIGDGWPPPRATSSGRAQAVADDPVKRAERIRFAVCKSFAWDGQGDFFAARDAEVARRLERAGLAECATAEEI